MARPVIWKQFFPVILIAFSLIGTLERCGFRKENFSIMCIWDLDQFMNQIFISRYKKASFLTYIKRKIMFDEILFYSFIYIFIGTIFILCTLLWAYLKKRLEKKSKNRPKDILIYILCIIMWPIVILILLYAIYEEWKDGRNDKANEFELKITDLVKKYERCEIELREIVCDPLNAVPPVPFGHLNGAWLKFCEQLEFQDELWTFDLIWPSPWGTQRRYAGYAAVRNSKIKTIFYTE